MQVTTWIDPRTGDLYMTNAQIEAPASATDVRVVEVPEPAAGDDI